MTQTFVISGTLPALNDLLRSRGVQRGKWSKYNVEKKAIEHRIACEIRAQGIRPIPGAVSFSFEWHEPNRRRDPDNITAAGRKLILDALVRCGVLDGDGWKVVKGWSDDFSVSKDNPCIVVTISPAV